MQVPLPALPDEDTLSRIALGPAAVARWQQRAKVFAREAHKHGVRGPQDIADELARVQADGSLLLFVALPDGAEFSMRVEPREWAWRGPRNH
jgi:hypothetical protein